MPPWNMRLKNSQRFDMIALCARIVSLSTTKVMSANAFDCSIRPRSALIVDGDTAGGFGRSSPSSDIRSVGAYVERKWVHTARESRTCAISTISCGCFLLMLCRNPDFDTTST